MLNVFIPPYRVWGILGLLCFVVCRVRDFSAAEKARGVKICMHVRVLSGVPDRSSGILVNFGWRRVTVVALLPG